MRTFTSSQNHHQDLDNSFIASSKPNPSPKQSTGPTRSNDYTILLILLILLLLEFKSK